MLAAAYATRVDRNEDQSKKPLAIVIENSSFVLQDEEKKEQKDGEESSHDEDSTGDPWYYPCGDRTKKIRFSKQTWVRRGVNRDQYTPYEFRVCWYTKEELEKIVKELEPTIKLMQDGKLRDNNNRHCARGLETKYDKVKLERRRQLRREGKKAVFKQQELQRTKAAQDHGFEVQKSITSDSASTSNNSQSASNRNVKKKKEPVYSIGSCALDHDAIAEAYHFVVATVSADAHHRGLWDAAEVKKLEKPSTQGGIFTRMHLRRKEPKNSLRGSSFRR